MERALILERDSPAPVASIGRILAYHFELHPTDAISRVRYCGGLLIESAPQDKVLEVARCLAEIDVRTRVVATDTLWALPRGYKIVSLTFSENEIRASKLTGSPLRLRRADIHGIHLYGLKPSGQEVDLASILDSTPNPLPLEAFDRATGAGLSPRARRLLDNLEAAELRNLCLHLTLYCVAPIGPVRIDRDDFDFSCLGEQKQTHSLDNFLLLLEDVLAYLPDAWNRQRAVEFLEDLDPKRIFCFKEEEARNFDRWMLLWVLLAGEEERAREGS